MHSIAHILVSEQISVALNDCRLPLPVYAQAPTRTKDDLAIHSLRPHPLLTTLDLDDGEHVVAFVPSLSQVAVFNQAALALIQRLPLAEDAEAAEVYGALVRLVEMGLLVTTDSPALPCPAEPTTLVAWLHLTNACNLRCTYCYIEKNHEAMSLATAYQAIEASIAAALRHGYRELALKYAGGEPLLAFDTLVATHQYAQEQCAAAGLGLAATVLTNGTGLTAPRVARLRELGLNVTVSLDGATTSNDQQRPMCNGTGSTAAIMAGLERAHAGGIRPAVALTITSTSLAGVPALVQWLLERDLPFTLSFARDHTCGRSHRDLLADEAALIEGMRTIYATVAANPPSWSLLGALLDRTDLSHAHGQACAAGSHYLVIDHHGRIAACQMVQHMPVADIYHEDPLGAIRHDGRLPLGRHVDTKEGCRTCVWRYWCGGGCPLATLRATGRTDIQSPDCNIYKALYPDLLRLEGLRLLHQH